MCAHIWVPTILCSALSTTSLSSLSGVTNKWAVIVATNPSMWTLEKMTLRLYSLWTVWKWNARHLRGNSTASNALPLKLYPTWYYAITGVDAARCLGWPPPLPREPLGLLLPPLPVLDPAPPAESCCAEGNLSTMLAGCPSVDVAATGCSASIKYVGVEPLPRLRQPLSLPWFNCLLLRWPVPVPCLPIWSAFSNWGLLCRRWFVYNIGCVPTTAR